MAMYAKIRRMHFREHLTISEIQRRTSLSRNTIKKWLKGDEGPHPQRRNRDSKLTPFEPLLKLSLETDAHRPKRDRRTVQRLLETIRQKGYTGGYSQLTDFIRRCREHTVITGKSAFVPLKFQLG
ncbi:MAG: IS21 family transposase, partial [Gammaproteobacteria bacterium]